MAGPGRGQEPGFALWVTARLGEGWVSLSPLLSLQPVPWQSPRRTRVQHGPTLLLIPGPSNAASPPLLVWDWDLTPLHRLSAEADVHATSLRVFHRSMRRLKDGFVLQILTWGLCDRDLMRHLCCWQPSWEQGGCS